MVELYLFNFWYFSRVPKISMYYFGSLRKDKLSGGISFLFKNPWHSNGTGWYPLSLARVKYPSATWQAMVVFWNSISSAVEWNKTSPSSFREVWGRHKIMCSGLKISACPILVCISKIWSICWKSLFLTPPQPLRAQIPMGPRNSQFSPMCPSRFRYRQSINHTLREALNIWEEYSQHLVKSLIS